MDGEKTAPTRSGRAQTRRSAAAKIQMWPSAVTKGRVEGDGAGEGTRGSLWWPETGKDGGGPANSDEQFLRPGGAIRQGRRGERERARVGFIGAGSGAQ